MRTLLATALLAVTALSIATDADARRKATKSEKRKIAGEMGIPPKCAIVHVSTVNEKWASLKYNHRKIDVEPCDEYAADGLAILRKSRGNWFFVTAGSSFECPIDEVPPKVQKDLKIPCY